MNRRLCVALLLGLALVSNTLRSQSPPTALFEGARLIVGDGSVIDDSAFIVDRESFAWVGKRGGRQLPAGGVRVDLTGKTVMPAFIDGHNHIGIVNQRNGSNTKANYTRENLVDQLERYAYYGVAAAMSMGLEVDQELAYQLREERIPNAALFLTVGKGIAATPIAGPPGEPRLGIPAGARDQREGRERVRELQLRGVHFVKIWVDDREGAVPKLQPAVYRTIIAEAHGNGMEVLAHLSRTSALADAKDLIKAGVDGFVHLVRDRDVDDEYLALVKSHPKIWSGPNIPVPLTMNTLTALAETLPAAQIDQLREQVQAREKKGNPPDELFELHCRNLRKIHDAGMTIGLGTDGTGNGFGPHEQVEAYTRCGLSPMEAIVAGTGTNARLLRLDRLGMIASKKEAAFVVLNANPLEDIGNTRRIDAVYLKGVRLDRAAMKARFVSGK